MKKDTLAKLLLVFVAIIWGGGFPLMKIVLDTGMKPNAIMTFRFLGSALLIMPYLFLTKHKFNYSEIKLGIIGGIFLGLAFSLQSIGLQYTTASNNAFLTGAYVVCTPFIFWFLTKNKPKLKIYISCLICFIGIGFLSLNDQLSMNKGDALSLFCAVFFACQIAIISARLNFLNPVAVNSIQMLTGGILTLIFNIIFENFSLVKVSLNSLQLASLAILIILNTLVAYLAQTFSQKVVAPSTTSLILSTEVIFGALISWSVLGDTFTIKTLIGAILIFSSIIIAEYDFNSSKKIREVD